MSTYLKKAIKTPETDERETQAIVERILEDVVRMARKRTYATTVENSKIGPKN
jgi:hypothetical protein